MADGHFEALREEKAGRANSVLAIAIVIGSKKGISGNDIWRMITGEEPPWAKANEEGAAQILKLSRERARRHAEKMRARGA